VRLKLYKGNVIVAGRRSPKSLYDPKSATMEGDDASHDQSDATGFIRLNALRLRLRASRQHIILRRLRAWSLCLRRHTLVISSGYGSIF
jgi:argininosuccinate synthase